MPSLFAQVPVAPPQSDVVGTVVAIGFVVALVVLFALVLRKLMKRRPEAPKLVSKAPEAEGIEKPAEKPKVELPPTEAEAAAREKAEALKREAEEKKARRAALEAEARAAAAAPEKAAEVQAEAAKLKQAEEAAKKEAYRAQKAAEAEEKARKQREREEAARLEAEAAAKAKAEAEAAERAKAEAEKARIAAEAGRTLAVGLEKTRKEGFMAKLNAMFSSPKEIDESVLAELEEVLFTADIGVKTASNLVELAREKAKSKELDSAEKLKGVIRKEIARIVDLEAPHALEGGGPPHVVMVVGVNGAGKTTTIGKLAAKAKAKGKKVLLGAGDTFRAAAQEQLDVWAERAGVDIVKGKEDADPASVIFDAVKKGVEEKYDLIIADTAGRLHTKANLMEELKKVKRVIGKALPGAPHEVLLVLDATNGQNAIMQARQFHESVGVTSIALTKLDGTAKGGVVIGICDELKVPVSWAGVGEKVADLRPFEPKEFVEAMFG